MDELRIAGSDGVSLAASYSRAGDTAVVALHSAAVSERHRPVYRHLHELLPPAGIGVVTFDRRGEGESTGEPSVDRFEIQADDALAVIEAIGVHRVGIWALSQGAWVGPLAAAESDAVAFLALVASTGVTPSEQMMYAVACQLRLARFDEVVVARALELRRRFNNWVHTPAPSTGEQLAADLRTYTGEPWWPHVWLPDVLLDDEGRRLWIEEMDFDPLPVFERVRVPTLLFYGEADSWTPVAPSVDAWRAARGDEVKIVVVPGAEHDMSMPDGSLAADYTGTLVEWVVSQQG